MIQLEENIFAPPFFVWEDAAGSFWILWEESNGIMALPSNFSFLCRHGEKNEDEQFKKRGSIKNIYCMTTIARNT